MQVERDGRSARRRRERRLLSWLRHERLTLAMAVAEATHHSSRGQRPATVIREVEDHEQYEAPWRQKAPPLGVAADQSGRAAVGVAWGGVQRHTVEQFGDLAPVVQNLDAPVPQVVD